MSLSDKSRSGIPVEAKLVFKGVIFEVWQWQQKMFDGTAKTFERIWRPPTVEVIATVGSKILIEYQDQPDNKNIVNLVSGRADQGTDMLEEAKRELLEETGYQSNDWRLFWKHGGSGKVLHDVYFFIARDCKKVSEQKLDAGAKIETKLISFEDFLELPNEPRFRTSPQFVNYLLQLKFDAKKREEFKNLLSQTGA
jgi:ADP-ribose pyrophosphatase